MHYKAQESLLVESHCLMNECDMNEKEVSTKKSQEDR